MRVSIRYTFRNPAQWVLPSAVLYGRLLDQIEWADGAGFDQVTMSEHHFLEEGLLPSLLPMAAAIAARTKRMSIAPDILLLPLQHPVKVAEDSAIVDIISNGRFTLCVAAGYREEEYAGFGISLKERAGRMNEGLQIVRKCWAEDEFSFNGKYYQLSNVRMFPKPVQRPGPKIVVGGVSEGAARRAARLGDDLRPQDPALWDIYYDELEKLGRPRPRQALPPPDPACVHVAHDPERAWAKLRPHAIFEMEQYLAWSVKRTSAYGEGRITEETLRKAHLVLTPEEAKAWFLERQAAYPDSTLHIAPVLGGMDPEFAQESLELIAAHVLPALREAAKG